MGTKLERISQLSKEKPEMVFTVIQQIKYGQNKQIICGLLSGLA